MDDDLCARICSQSGPGIGEILLTVIVIVRWVWAEFTRRQLVGKTAVLETQKAELKGQVKALSVPSPGHGIDVELEGPATPPDGSPPTK